jgi:ELWxxDGT repeat protein
VLDFIVSEFLKDKERYGVFYSTDGTGRNTKRMRDQKFVPDAEPSASNLFCNASDTAVWSVETITTTNAQGRLVTYSRLRRQAEPSPSCLKILKSAEEITCVGGLTDTCAMLFVRQPEGCFQLLRAEVDELRRCKTDVIKEFKSEFIIPSWKTELVVIDGTLYFVLNRREGGVELWRTDGTKKGTKKVKRFKNRCHSLVERRGKLYFVGG